MIGLKETIREFSATRCVLAMLVCLPLMLPVPARAVEVSGLFTAEVPLAGPTRDQRDAAYRRALNEVIGRLVERGTADPSAWQPLLAEPRQLVIGYRDNGDHKLWVSFDGSSLVRALRGANVKVWGSDRPLTIVWLAVDRGAGERVILSGSERTARGALARRADPADYLRERLEKAAAKRGLPVVLPLMDARDQQAIEFADVWGDFAATIERASERYRAGSLLVGRVSKARPDAIRWTWRFAGGVETFNGSVESAVRRVAADMSGMLSLASADDARRLRLRVDGVDDVAGFGALLKFLRRQPQVSRLDIVAMDGATLTLELGFIGSTERFERLLESYPSLQRVATRPQSGTVLDPVQGESLLPILEYRLQN